MIYSSDIFIHTCLLKHPLSSAVCTPVSKNSCANSDFIVTVGLFHRSNVEWSEEHSNKRLCDHEETGGHHGFSQQKFTAVSRVLGSFQDVRCCGFAIICPPLLTEMSALSQLWGNKPCVPWWALRGGAPSEPAGHRSDRPRCKSKQNVWGAISHVTSGRTALRRRGAWESPGRWERLAETNKLLVPHQSAAVLPVPNRWRLQMKRRPVIVSESCEEVKFLRLHRVQG